MNDVTYSRPQIEAARNVLGHLSANTPGAWATGGFTGKLIEAMCSADEENIAKLGVVYPELAMAVDTFKNNPGGVELLSEMALAKAHE